ncbi:DNA-binding response OmpR family regulator [Granulicella aggregans]|uniref:DNA-binding response OmpR family regulator n=1 Tax=Granulicella aggregans TaxID=474949 RepID=A0A7W7ZDW0_9BACT|nr:DNA-binding response OmpR family regulator [Granulicella aggregans]
MSKRVLIHGADPTLLETRRRILSLDGIAAETVLNGSIMVDLIRAKRPDLLIVCSSLPLDLQQRDVRAASAVRPKVRCLVLAPHRHTGSEISDADTVVHPFDGPERFVSEVRKLLSS